MQFKYFSVKEIQRFINENDIAVRKKFGQNFLINSGAVDRIINYSNINEKDAVIEIGCGLGSLTNRLIEKGCQVFGFEIDRVYVQNLRKMFTEYENFKLIEGDFLKNVEGLFKEINIKDYNNIIILGNIPYYITTPILEKIFLTPIYYDKLVFMVQKEVANRIVSKEGSKEYGSLSIFCQYFTIPKIIAKLSPKSFYPSPKVDSAVVYFDKNNDRLKADNEKLFFKIARSIFINRRKQIKNNLFLSPLLKEIDNDKKITALKITGIPEIIRGEVLSINKIIELSNNLNDLIK